MYDFKNALIGLMNERGISQADLARMTGFSTGMVSMYISGKREPTLTNAVILAGVLGCTLDELAGFSGGQ